MTDTPQPKRKHIPQATIKRLATYVQVLESLARDNVSVISSNPLAEACGVQGSQIRKDLAYFGEFGIRGVGYQVNHLISSITSSLGVDHEWPMVLVGVGNLGKAMINHIGFHAHGFHIKAIFDCDPFKIGDKVHGLEVFPTQEIKPIVEKLGVEIAVITTPPERAQRAASYLAEGGIKGILNFAPARIKVPDHVHVEYVDFFRHMYNLIFNLTQDPKEAKPERDAMDIKKHLFDSDPGQIRD
ncbi:MAG: redox-sensing transcriptional repressor Rex [Desulfovibrio sp.]|nr:redox-sensing transcriptional repressor Rex [Desulfovibrio sp.]